MTALLAALLCHPAIADEPQEVLVAPFQTRSDDVAGVTALLHDFLEQQVDGKDELAVVPVERAGKVFDQTASLYLESCPPMEEVGCALVVAEAAHVPYAVTGYVEKVEGRPHIHVWILDVPRMRQVEFERDLEVGQDEALVNEIAGTVMAVVNNEAGVPVDERFRVHKTEAELADEETRDAEKHALATDKTGPGKLEAREEIEVERQKYTESDLAARMEVEGGKPWDRLGMTPRQYIRYQNSGFTLQEWRTRADGRKAQLLIRPGLGLLRAPAEETYYGRYVRDAETLAVIQRYAWQGVATSSAVTGTATVSYGVLPQLEVGLTGGFANAHYDVDITAVTEGDAVRDHEPTTYSSRGLYFGPTVLAALLPTSSIRPVIGASFFLWQGTSVDEHVQVPEELQVFDPTSIGLMEVRVGAEFRLGPHLDAYAHVPVQALVFGGDPQVQQEGGEYLTGTENPTSPDAVSAGILLGFQVRLFGPKEEARTLDSYGED